MTSRAAVGYDYAVDRATAQHINRKEVNTMTNAMLNAKIASGELIAHHTASRRGYISRRNPDGIIESYAGKFGRGYIRVLPRWDSTQYVTIEYYVEA